MRGVADVVQSGLTAKSGVKKQLARRRWAPKWVSWRPRKRSSDGESSQQGEVIKKAKKERNGEAGLCTSEVPKSFTRMTSLRFSLSHPFLWFLYLSVSPSLSCSD